MKLNEDKFAIINFYDDEKNIKIKKKINECWYVVKKNLSDEVIKTFTELSGINLDKYDCEMGNNLCGDILEKDKELCNCFFELGILNKDSMKYFIICEWHKETQEPKAILKNESIIKKHELLIEPIKNLWLNIKETMFNKEDMLSKFINTRVSELFMYHMGLGTYLRNTILKPDNELYKKFIDIGTTQPDDMSSVMIRIWHKSLREGILN